jgi:hypothetical protein
LMNHLAKTKVVTPSTEFRLAYLWYLEANL